MKNPSTDQMSFENLIYDRDGILLQQCSHIHYMSGRKKKVVFLSHTLSKIKNKFRWMKNFQGKEYLEEL